MPLTRNLKARFPELVTIWGGYFPSLHSEVVLESGFVDYVIRGQGEDAFLELIEALEHGRSPKNITNLSFRAEECVVHNNKRPLRDLNELPRIPYHRIEVEPYVGRTCLGSRTLSYHSSFGCPFRCGFCAVAEVYRGIWVAKSAQVVGDEIVWLQQRYGIDAVEFVDNNFFVSERRCLEIAERLKETGIRWWGEARPDTMMGFSDQTWRAMADSGLQMVFFGVESRSQSVLDTMDKGGTQTPEMVLELAERTKKFGVTPEFSFVLGTPSNDVDDDIERDIRYIRQIKEVNPRSEIVIYVYSPVHFDDATLFQRAKEHGFRFPSRLEDWAMPPWKEFDLRKNPSTPWLEPRHLQRIRNFELVLNARYPTISDIKLRAWQVLTMKALGAWRYRTRFYNAPFEIRFVANRLFKYRQPELEGL